MWPFHQLLSQEGPQLKVGVKMDVDSRSQAASHARSSGLVVCITHRVKVVDLFTRSYATRPGIDERNIPLVLDWPRVLSPSPDDLAPSAHGSSNEGQFTWFEWTGRGSRTRRGIGVDVCARGCGVRDKLRVLEKAFCGLCPARLGD